MNETIIIDALFSSPITLDLEITTNLYLVCSTYRSIITSSTFLHRLAEHYKYPYEEGVTTFSELLTQISREHYTCYSYLYRSANWVYDRCPDDEKEEILLTGLVDTERPAADTSLVLGYTNDPKLHDAPEPAYVIIGLLAGGHRATLQSYKHVAYKTGVYSCAALIPSIFSLDVDLVRYVVETGLTWDRAIDRRQGSFSMCSVNSYPRAGYLTLKVFRELIAYVTTITTDRLVLEFFYHLAAAHDSPECWEYLCAHHPEWHDSSLIRSCCIDYCAVKIFAHVLKSMREDIGKLKHLDNMLSFYKRCPIEITTTYETFIETDPIFYSLSTHPKHASLRLMRRQCQKLEYRG